MIKVQEDHVALVAYSARRIVKLIDATLQFNDRFSLVLTGGSTPRPIYQRIASDYAQTVDWNRVHIFFGDERAVPPDHPDSNYGMAQAAMLDALPIPAENIYRLRGEADPTDAAHDYEKQIRAYFRDEDPGFDLLLLGLGDDAHIASLFPGTDALSETERWVIAHHVEKLAAWRLTMTAPLINLAANIMFIVSGEKKAEAVHHVLEGDHDPQTYPGQLVRTDFSSVFWSLDTAAAAKLTETPFD